MPLLKGLDAHLLIELLDFDDLFLEFTLFRFKFDLRDAGLALLLPLSQVVKLCLQELNFSLRIRPLLALVVIALAQDLCSFFDPWQQDCDISERNERLPKRCHHEDSEYHEYVEREIHNLTALLDEAEVN